MVSSFLVISVCQTQVLVSQKAGRLPLEYFPSPSFLNLTLGDGLAKRFRESFNSGHQRFYRLTTRHRLLG